MKIRQPLTLYLENLQERRIDPNFYVSLPYLTLSNTACFEDNGWLWVEDEAWCIFPPIPSSIKFKPDPLYYPQKNVWSDFSNFTPSTPKLGFLDWEYIFDCQQFNQMQGGHWEVYRKNARKWGRNNVNWVYDWYVELPACAHLVCEWLEAKMDSVEDAELIAQFTVGNVKDVHKKYLYNSNKDLVAVNVWDDNYKYINYRLCIVAQGEPFLDEFARWLFYTDPEIQNSGKLINDGGCLGNAGLERFKDKMNPVRKREVYSWIIR